MLLATRHPAAPPPPVEITLRKALIVQLIAPALPSRERQSKDTKHADPQRFRAEAGSGSETRDKRIHGKRSVEAPSDLTAHATPSRQETDSELSGAEDSIHGRDGLYILADKVWLAWVEDRSLILAFAKESEPREVLRVENQQLRVSLPPAGYVRRALEPGRAPGRMYRFLVAAAKHWDLPRHQVRLVVFYPSRDWSDLRSLAEAVPAPYRRWRFERGQFLLVPHEARQ